MPLYDFKETPYKPGKTLILNWDTFRGGLNTLLRQTEIKDFELAQMDNIKLVGKGVPTKREGTINYFLTAPSVATGAQRVRGIKGVNFASGASGVNELLAVSDWGMLVKKANASYSIIQGSSYASGYNSEMVQIYNKVFISNGQDSLTHYNGASIYSYTQVGQPTTVQATNLSGVSGPVTRSFRVSALTDVGETIAAPNPVVEDAVLLVNTPEDLADTTIRISWTGASPASSVAGYSIYGVNQGDERYITTVDASTNQYDYQGIPDPANLVFPSAADTTTGPKGKYLIAFGDKLIIGNVDGFPSRFYWSGGGENVDKFSRSYGGGFLDVDKDSGDKITGLIEFQNSLIVFKERSIWKVLLNYDDSSGLVIPDIELIVRGVGAVSHRTIKHVENDVFFLSRNGVFTLGNEANYLNVLRTNELSARVRPTLKSIEENQAMNACAAYHDTKYRLSFPIDTSGINKKEIVYDRERRCWIGPNTYPSTPGVFEVYYDGNNREQLVWGDTNDNFVTLFDSGSVNDKGVKIQTSVLTKKTAFDSTFRFKQVRELFTNWRNVSGSPFVNVILETRDGAVGTAETFSVTASSGGVGWGFDTWGATKWGTTGGAGDSEASNDLAKRTRLYKIARTVQLEVTTTGNNDRYELLSAQLKANELGAGIIPSTWDTS